MSIALLLISIAVIAASGIPALLLGRRSAAGQGIATILNVVGSIIGAVALAAHYVEGSGAHESRFSWPLAIGNFSLGVDDLSVLFLIPMLLISALGSVYGMEYWKQSRHPANGRKLRACWGLLTAAMMLVVIARDAVLFLMAWEIMALTAFFLVDTEDQKRQVRRAAWIYLVATHCGTLCLLAMFGLLRYASGSFALWPIAGSGLSSWLPAAAFVTGIIGFGFKAGIMPLHVWLPGAHANAPSHVSAMLSGVMLKAGVYGIIRIASFLPHPPIWWGGALLVVGAISGILGIAYAIAQQDFKRLLAYSSIENIGIIMLGIGLALLGRSVGHPKWIVLGLGGSLLHVLNHSLFKPLLFMGAGNILHATRTRQIDLLGGLAKPMPRTFVLAIIGAIGICALPPLNGFVSELLIYLGLLRTASAGSGSIMWAALAAPALAVIGALAVSTFVKLIGMIFAGSPRTHAALRAHESRGWMLAPMAILAAGCIAIGLAPALVVGSIVQRAVRAWEPAASQANYALTTLVPLQTYSVIAVTFSLLVFIATAFLLRRRPIPFAKASTWDCGYARPTPRIQYTGSSFGDFVTALFAWALMPSQRNVRLPEPFPQPQSYASHTGDVVLDRGVLPSFRFIQRLFSFARPVQRGPVQVYLLYVLAIVLVLLLFAWW